MITGLLSQGGHKCTKNQSQGRAWQMQCPGRVTTVHALFPNRSRTHTHKDKLQCKKGLLRNRDMTLGRFFTRQDEVLAFHPHTRQEYTASCRGCWKLERHSLAEMLSWPGFRSTLLCHAKGSGRSHQFCCLAEHQPQRLIQLSCRRYFYSSAEKHSPAPQSSHIFPHAVLRLMVIDF